MKIQNITPSIIKLKFSSTDVPFPKDLAVVVNGYQISGFECTKGIFYEGELGDFIKSMYSNLKLSELAWLRDFTLTNKAPAVWDSIAKAWPSLGEMSNTRAVEVLSQLDPEFQGWVDDKHLSLSEIHPLYLWYINGKPISTLQPLTKSIVDLKCTRQEGSMALEYAIDLFLMGNMSSFHITSSDKAAWLSEIRTQRFPRITQKDSDAETRVQSAPWPKQVKGKAARLGDASHIELKINFQNEKDFTQLLEQLSKDKDQICQHLWPRI